MHKTFQGVIYQPPVRGLCMYIYIDFCTLFMHAPGEDNRVFVPFVTLHCSLSLEPELLISVQFNCNLCAHLYLLYITEKTRRERYV